MPLTNEEKDRVRTALHEEVMVNRLFQRPYKVITSEDEILIERFKAEIKNNRE